VALKKKDEEKNALTFFTINAFLLHEYPKIITFKQS
jgi:hypothetical protein